MIQELFHEEIQNDILNYLSGTYNKLHDMNVIAFFHHIYISQYRAS